tara:strand:- start:584 stop:1306 length:723 start_codon:yes stop_codon:yes gene_type:complete
MIIYKGASELDGQPIVVIATGYNKDSSNSKTGDMLQTWILREDIDPREANKSGADYSICGNCKHRGTAHADANRAVAKERTCYVAIHHAPLNVWRTYHRGRYAVANDRAAIVALGSGRKVRLGSYGDPAAVPQYVWDNLLAKASGHTGYSHQQTGSFNPEQVMVSADSLIEAEQAWLKNWRTFRVVKQVSEVQAGKEILCPASKEAGQRTNCASCGLCAGALIQAKSVAIVAHGSGAKYA